MVAVQGQRLVWHFHYAASVESESVSDVYVFSETGAEVAFVESVYIGQILAVYSEVASDKVACGSLQKSFSGEDRETYDSAGMAMGGKFPEVKDETQALLSEPSGR